MIGRIVGLSSWPVDQLTGCLTDLVDWLSSGRLTARWLTSHIGNGLENQAVWPCECFIFYRYFTENGTNGLVSYQMPPSHVFSTALYLSCSAALSFPTPLSCCLWPSPQSDSVNPSSTLTSHTWAQCGPCSVVVTLRQTHSHTHTRSWRAATLGLFILSLVTLFALPATLQFSLHFFWFHKHMICRWLSLLWPTAIETIGKGLTKPEHNV